MLQMALYPEWNGFGMNLCRLAYSPVKTGGHMQKKLFKEMQSALALVATVVGAGFASGREIMRFFTMYGKWSWVGCVVAGGMMAAFSAWTAMQANALQACDLGTLCRRSIGGRMGHFAAWLNAVLCIVTAGAMLASMGEIFALALPVHGAYEIGIVVSLALGAALAGSGITSLSGIGGWLLPVCMLLYTLLLKLPVPQTLEVYTPSGAWRGVPMAVAYAAMNAAIGCGVMCEIGQDRKPKEIIRSCAIAFGLLTLLLVSANASLYRRQKELLHEVLPVVQLARALGSAGYWLCISALSLAVLTTLVALLRTVYRMLLQGAPHGVRWGVTLVLPLLLCFARFDMLVGQLYPLLGAASAFLFVVMLAKPIAQKKQVRKRKSTMDM